VRLPFRDHFESWDCLPFGRPDNAYRFPTSLRCPELGMSPGGIPLGSVTEDLSQEKLDTSETSGRTSDVTPVTATSVATVTGETSSSVGLKRQQVQATAGETAGTLIFPQNEPRPSESRGTAWANSTPIKAEPEAEPSKSRPMDDRSPSAMASPLVRKGGQIELTHFHPVGPISTHSHLEGKSHPVESARTTALPALVLTYRAVYPVDGGAANIPKSNDGWSPLPFKHVHARQPN
jgi:hypothetical protein